MKEIKRISLIAFICLSFLSTFLGKAQSKQTKAIEVKDCFFEVDKYARSIKEKNLDSLSLRLTSKFVEEIDKVRSIFIWITNNIQYDVKGYHSTNIYAEIEIELDGLSGKTYYEKYNKKIVEKVFKEKPGICDGYSRLFKYLCAQSNLKAEVIIGYARIKSDTIGVMQPTSHAWNAVSINKKMYLLDATWASGYANNAVTVFTKKYNNFYFLTSPSAFINTHYPEVQKWTLLKTAPSLIDFFNAALIERDFYELKIKSFLPKEGILLRDSINSPVKFEITADVIDSSLVIIESYIDPKTKKRKDNFRYLPNLLTLKTKLKAEYIFSKNKVNLNYAIQKATTDKLYVYYKSKLILIYRVKNKQTLT